MPIHLIDYGHMRDGVLYHGTVSDLDGAPKSTWTFENGGEKVTRDRPIDVETFNYLWNGIADFEVFKYARVRSPGVPIDPRTHHVVGIAFEEGAQRGRCMFLIPVEERDPDFARWLEALQVPEGRL
jgi:hypothetical protein